MKTCFTRMTNVMPGLLRAVPPRPRHSSDAAGTLLSLRRRTGLVLRIRNTARTREPRGPPGPAPLPTEGPRRLGLVLKSPLLWALEGAAGSKLAVGASGSGPALRGGLSTRPSLGWQQVTSTGAGVPAQQPPPSHSSPQLPALRETREPTAIREGGEPSLSPGIQPVSGWKQTSARVLPPHQEEPWAPGAGENAARPGDLRGRDAGLHEETWPWPEPTFWEGGFSTLSPCPALLPRRTLRD